MKLFVKGMCSVLLMAVSFSYAQATTINFTLTGTVQHTYENNWRYDANPFGLRVGDTITAKASFDDSLIRSSGLTMIDFENPNIEMFITVGNTVYSDADDFSDGAWLYFDDGYFDGLSYNSSDGKFDSSNFCCDFYGYDFDGKWDNMEISAVPVPAAVWLFGSGLIGLVGFARRKNQG